MPPKVFLSEIDGQYLQKVQSGLEWIEFGSFTNRQTSLFIKPNLTFPTYRQGVMTNPKALEAVIQAVKDYTDQIYIGDADSGGYNRFQMDEVYRATGIVDFASKYGVKIVNLSHCERKPIQFSAGERSFTLDLPRLLTDEMDFLLTMPVPKIHGNTGVSLTFKNQWGCIPEPQDRLRMHPYFKYAILAVNQAVKTKVAVIDGTYGLNKNGPLRGTAVELNWVMVSNSIGAAARIALELMQIPLRRIEHLMYAETKGLIPARNEIELNNSTDAFIREKFYLQREIMDYPGLMAFRNSHLAYLAYFSPFANFLHRLIYLFREPFYDYDKYSKR